MAELDEEIDNEDLKTYLQQQQKKEDEEKSIYEQELEKKNISDSFEYVIKLLDEHINFETRYKSKLILIMAEKIEKTGFPQKEIIEHLIEEFAGRISEQHIRKSLPERFKKPSRVTAQIKANATKTKNKIALAQQVSNSSVVTTTVFEDALSKDKDKIQRETLPNFKPSIKSDYSLYSDPEDSLATPSSSDNNTISLEYVKSLEKTIAILNGEIPYSNRLAIYKVMKMDKIKAMQFYEAIKSSLREVVVTVDSRTNNIVQIFTDKGFKKMLKSNNKFN